MNESVNTANLSIQPPFHQRPRQLVILLGARLIGLDTILPVAMALKAEDPTLKIVFLFLNRKTLPTVKKNYVLYRGILDTGRIAVLSEGRNGIAGKIIAGVRLIGWCWRFLCTPTLFFCYSDVAHFPIQPMAWTTRQGGGGVVLYAKAAHPGNPALRHAHRSKEARIGYDVRFADPGDAFLIYHPDQIEDYVDFTEMSATVIGSPRNYPAWRKHLEKVRITEGIKDEHGRPVDLAAGPVLAAFYPGDVVIPTQVDNARNSFIRFLTVLTEEVPEAVVLVKPHPLCDQEILRQDIAAFDRLAVFITYAHPQLLASVARAAVFTNGSYAMNDVLVEGTPILETSVYTTDILDLSDSLFPNRGRLDCSSDDKLRKALRQFADTPDLLPTPDTTHLLWSRPDSLLTTLCQN